MRHRPRLVLLLAMVLVSGACWAANRNPVTLRAQDTSVQPLLRTLLQLGGCSYVFAPDVPDDYVRSIAIVSVPFEVALESLARSWGFTCAFEDRLCSVMGSASEIRGSPSSVADPGRTAPPAKEENTYYLARGAHGGRRDEPNRVSLGPRTEKLNPALVAYADAVSRLVTPEALDDLAFRLRQQVDASSYLQDKLAREQIGLTQFRTVNIRSQAAAIDVAEDLSTSLIRLGFNLVERAQLDKAFDELHLQDTALIDPATANRLGRMTGCGIIVLGSISDRGGVIVINARLVETATGRALAADRAIIGK